MRSNSRTALATALILIALLSGGAFAGVGHAQVPVPGIDGMMNARTITVTGTGQAGARPDQAVVVLGVVTESERAADALSQNSREVQGVIDALRQAGIAEGDMQTQTVQLQPRRPVEPPLPQSEAPAIEGFTATNTLRVRVRALDQLGQLLDTVTQAGANEIQGISLTVSDPGQYQSEARQAAWQDALDRATELASLAGLNLGPVMTMTESDFSGWPVDVIGAAAESAVPIVPGTESIRVTIQVTWALSGAGTTSPVPSPATLGTATMVPASPSPVVTATPVATVTSVATVTPAATASGLLPPTAIATATQLATPSLLPTTETTPLSTAQASTGSGAGATAQPLGTPRAPSGTAVASEPALPVRGWQRMVIPEIGIAFDLPQGWQQQGSEWTWAAPGPGAPRVGIDWQDVTRGWRPTMMLPDDAQILQQRQEWFGLVPGTSFVVLVEDEPDRLPYQTHVIVRLSSRAYDAFSMARSAEELAQLDEVLERILASVRFVGDARASDPSF